MMLHRLVGGSPRRAWAGKSPRTATRKLRAVVESLEGRTMMSVAISSVADQVRLIPAEATTVTSSRVMSNLASPARDWSSVTGWFWHGSHNQAWDRAIRRIRGQLGVGARVPSRFSLSLPSHPQIKPPGNHEITTLGFDTPLVKKINELVTTSGKNQNLEGRKSLLLNYALVNYENLLGTNKSSMKAYELTDASYYSTKGKSGPKAPDYFSTTSLGRLNLPTSTSVIYAPAGHYDYKPTGTAPQFWVDFANSTLGGGVFTDGFLQEETMFLETPELANAAAQTPALKTRTGGNGPLNGSPTPLIFLGANRVMSIDWEWMTEGTPRENENWRVKNIGEVVMHDTPLSKQQNINVLSMAAPDLHLTDPNTHPKEQSTPDVLEDLFNTFYAGFTMAEKAFSGSTILINTGPIGAGGFTNNKVVVNIMQQLAAIVVSQQSGHQVNLKFWGYNDPAQEIQDTKDAVNKIITNFNMEAPKPISRLLDIAQPIAEAIAKKYPTPK